MKFDAIIPFCSEDNKYIQHCIDGVKNLANSVIVTYWDRMFDGSEENMDIINILKIRNPNCRFIEIPYEKNENMWWYYGHSRFVGYQNSSIDSSHVMFLDADEIFEEKKLEQWLNLDIDFDVSYFANYWYFRDERYQAKTYEDSPVMVKKNKLELRYFYTNFDRRVFLTVDGIKKLRMTLGLDGLPMCHHYSWVLSKEKMLKKVLRSAHKNDFDWSKLIDKEFDSEFRGIDFIHGYKYNILEKGYI